MNIRLTKSLLGLVSFATALYCAANVHANPSATSGLTEKILQMRSFREGLVLTGTNQPTDAENKELMELLKHLDEPWWTTGLEQFLHDYPDSAWSASLHYDYACFCRRTGRTTKALEHFQAAWDLAKNDTNPQGQRLGGAILGDWMNLLSRLGRLEELGKLVAVGNSRHFVNHRDRRLFEQARNAYYLMRNHPGIAFRCGTFALKSVGQVLDPTNRALEGLVEIPSPANGFTMANLIDFSKQYGLDLVAVRRTSGQQLIVPSVIHWRQNHYAAILQKQGDLYLVNDPTFDQSQWMPADVINEEVSGEFLVPARLKPGNWPMLTMREMKKIHGMGLGNNINDANDRCCKRAFNGQVSCTHCTGMPVWWVSEPYINLWLQDQPISYYTSKGELFPFQITYKQRDTREVELSEDTFLENNWNNSWFSFIAVSGSETCGQIGYPGDCEIANWGTATLYLPNGGAVDFSKSTYDPETRLRLQYRVGGLAAGGDTGANGVQVVHPDGAVDVYGTIAAGYYPNNGIPVNDYLLTEHIDSHGNTTWFRYGTTNTYTILQQVIDYDGLTNNLIYDSDAHLLQIVNPYGLTANFKYDSSGDLISITDARGLTSTIAYDSNGNPTSMTTPYGTTTFSLADDGATYDNEQAGNAGGDDNGLIDRSALVVDPTGSTNMYIYRYDSEIPMVTSSFTTGIPTTTPFGTLDTGTGTNAGANSQIYFRNSFHWGPMQCGHLSTQNMTNFTANDYLLARMQHWLQDTNALYVTDLLSVERDPSLDGINPGLLTFYDYSGKTYDDQEGTGILPSVRAYQLADGSTHYDYLNFDYSGNITSWASTYSLANGDLATRTNQFIYADNTYTVNLGAWNGSGFISSENTSYTVPDLLTQVIGPDGNPIWSCGGFDAVSTTNFFVQLDPPNSSTNAIITSWSRVLPDYVTNALGQITTFTYTPLSQSMCTIENDTNNNSISQIGNCAVMDEVASRTSVNGLITTNIYNPNGSLAETIDEQIGRNNSFTYTTNGLIGSWTDERGMNINLVWDNLLDLTAAYFPDGTYDYVYYNQSVTPLDPFYFIDRIGNATRFSYDGDRHLIASTRGNETTSYDWCGCGALTAVIDALNRPTTINYDNQENITNITYPDGTSLTYRYDLAERMTNVSDASGRSLAIGYNNQGLMTSVSNTYGLVESIVYDIKDRPIQVTDANGVTVTNTYDALNELLSRTWSDGLSETYGYGPAGMVAYTNRDNKVTLYGYDVAARLTSVTNADNEVVQLGYDPAGDITNLTDGLGHTTSWQYNQYGWMVAKFDPLNRNIVRYSYNPDGWVTTRTTPQGGTVNYGYDGLGNITSISYPNYTNNYVYDAINELTNMTDPVGTTAFAYTLMGQLQSETGPWANDAVTNAYSQMLRTAMAIYTNGFAYKYDAAWRLTNVTSAAGSFGYSYNVAPGSSLVSAINLPTGGGIANQYDSFARLKQTLLESHSGQTLDGYAYSYDPLGLRTNIIRTLGSAVSTVSVGYDPIGQLTSWTAKEADNTPRLNEQLGWTYDDANNLLSRANNQLSEGFIVDAANELTNITRSGTFTVDGATLSQANSVTVNGQIANLYSDMTFAAPGNALNNGNNNFTSIAQNATASVTNTLSVNLPKTVTLQYDADGNLISDGRQTMSYNSDDELTNVQVAGQWRSVFVYDGLRRRRIERDYAWGNGQWIQTNEIHTVYDLMLPIQERDGNNNVLVTYTRGIDLSGSLYGAGGIGGLLARTTPEGSAYYHSDGAGNITALVTPNDYLAAQYLYGPFGQVIGKWGGMADINEMQFSSMPHQNLSGLSLYSFRAYKPNFQRWPNQDPIQEAGGINLYRAMNNNPVSWIDPYGLQIPSPVNVAMGMFPPAGESDAEWDSQFAAANAQATAIEAGALAGTATSGGIMALAPEGLATFAGGYPLAAGAGAAGGYVGNGVANTVNGQPFNQNGGTAAALGAALGAGAKAISCPTKATVPVSRWGRPGLQPGDFVMTGPKSPLNYMLSGKYQPASWPGANQPAPYSSGVTYNVPPSSLSIPPGPLGPVKAMLGQRIYNP